MKMRQLYSPRRKGLALWSVIFADTHSGFCDLRQSVRDLAKVTNPKFSHKLLLKYSANKEGHWMSKKFMTNIEVYGCTNC